MGKFRLIGDIGLRAFFQLYRKAKELIQSERMKKREDNSYIHQIKRDKPYNHNYQTPV